MAQHNPDHSFPEKAMTRLRLDYPLSEIFEMDNSEPPQPKYFDSKTRRQNGMKYRIPAHQRYPQWKSQQKNSLIDTVFRNYPMNGIVVSQHVEYKEVYYDIEDGQTRLSILQGFFRNEFPFTLNDGTVHFYSDLPIAEQRKFDSYRITIDVLSDINENGYDISEAFDRLQCGRPLRDKDLYWNRKDEYPLIIKAFSLINQPYWLTGFMNTIKGITDKHRNQLPEVVTLIYAIINYHYKKNSEATISKRKTFSKCFREQVQNLEVPISDENNARIKKFLTYLNEIINGTYEMLPQITIPREKVNTWCNLANQTGMILHEWLENETAGDDITESSKNKWIKLMCLERQSADLMFKGKKTMWNGMTSSSKQNTDDASIIARLERVNEFFENPENTADSYSIKYNLNVDGMEDDNTDSE
jgi:hypothetical protein